MANLLIRFYPTEAMLGSDFTNSLLNLELDFYDISFGNLNPSTPILSGAYPANIFQNGSESVATGVFDFSGAIAGNEFDSLDLRVVVKRNVSGVITVLSDTVIGYNLELEASVPGNIHKAKPGAYIFIPPKDAKLSSLFPKSGEPWTFENLTKVLLNDSGTGDPNYDGVLFKETGNSSYDLSTLTRSEVEHLAREIVTGERDNYPPISNQKNWKLYTTDPGNPDEEVNEKFYNARTQLVSNIESHQTSEESRTKELMNYLWALVCAEYAAKQSALVTDILFRFPIKLPNFGSEEMNILNLSAGLVSIPAEYYYVHGIVIPVDIGKEKRYEQIKTEEQDVLLNLFQRSEEKGIANLSGTGKTHHQVIRLLRAQHTNRPTLPTIDLTSGTYGNPDLKVEDLITGWSNHTGPDSLGFWSGALTGLELEGHSELVMFLFVQGNAEFFNYLDNRFANIEVTAGTLSLLDINDDDIENDKTEWETLYQDYLNDVNTVDGDSGVLFLPPGTLAERKSYFATYACEFFGDLSVVLNDFSLDIVPIEPPLFSEEEGPIQKFIKAFIAAHGSLDDLGDPAKTEPIIVDCFPDDICGQEWLRGKINLLHELWSLTNIASLREDPADPQSARNAIGYSVMEVLFSLGIMSVTQLQNMSLDDFKKCVTGTIITSTIAEEIYDGITYTQDPIEDEFIPINPGDLVDCIPPECFSKTGRYAYLQDLLAFKIGAKTVSELLLETRGLSFDEFLVSGENCDLEIPTIDVLNGMLEGFLCNEGIGVGNFEPERFILKKEEFRAVTIAQKEQYFIEINSAVTPNDLTSLIQIFGTQTCNLSGVQGYIENFCLYLNTELDNGNFNNWNDLLTHLSTQEATNPFAAILLEFINGLMSIDPAQFEIDAAIVLDELGTLTTNPIIEFVSCIIEGVSGGIPQYIGIGNSTYERFDTYIPDNRKNDEIYIQEVVQSIPMGSSLNGQVCAYEKLAVSTKEPCKLPYHQPLAISKAYLEALGTTRFDLARKFSQHIHGFPYDPGNVPVDYKSNLFRLPVNLALAREYLCVSPQEYSLYYEQSPFPVGGTSFFHELLGYDDVADLSNYSILDEFLKKNCLECCDLDCWLQSGFSTLEVRDASGDLIEYDCNDCNTSEYEIDVLGGASGPVELELSKLWHITWLIRLSRQLEKAGISCYTCEDLVLIAEKLSWITYDVDGLSQTIDPYFLEQFVALDMLRAECGICFKFKDEDGEYVYLTDLLEGPSGANWDNALTYFIDKIVEKCNEGKEADKCRSPQFIKLVVEHIDILSKLAGFRDDADDNCKWYFQFTNIIRFAQVLQRICDSVYTAGQLQFIFTADGQLVGDDPYPQQTQNEALEYPFNIPDNLGGFDLESLREKLLNVELEQSDIDQWTWHKIDAHLQTDFGYTGTGFLDMSKRFFPEMMESMGYSLTNADKQFQETLAVGDTSPPMWNTGSVTPLFYIPGFLICRIPFKKSELIEKLQSIRQLEDPEEEAVQNLFFAPHLALTPFDAFFENSAEAHSVLIETEDEQARLEYFRNSFARFYKKCQIITNHFTTHISEVLAMPDLDERVVWKILAHLYANDNPALSTWEVDTGLPPNMRFPDKIQAGAFSALANLTGTGVKGTFKNIDGDIVWREIKGGLTAYGEIENRDDCPIPTVVPHLDPTLANVPLIAVVRNGFALTNGTPSKVLGGVQGYEVEYKGVLYVTESGTYKFRAGAPTAEGEIPDFNQAKHSQWQLVLKRGNMAWIVLDNDWDTPDTPGDCSVNLQLKRGAYDVCFAFKQPEPSLQNMEEGCPQPTGWQIKWTTPYQPEWHTIPISHLYHKEPFGDLSDSVQHLHATALDYLKEQYQPCIAGMRRTAIQVFASGLLMHGSGISAEHNSDSGSSEFDFMLNNPTSFEGFSHYKNGGVWNPHLVGFNLNFLPVLDNYCPPDASVDKRVDPSVQRIQALFEWFEQLWEINELKKEASAKGLNSVWHLWHECAENHPDLDGHLQKYLGVGFDKTHLVTQFHAGINLTCPDLQNEEWTIRGWEILKCIEHWECKLGLGSYEEVKPSIWVDIDFASKGNENLVSFITKGYLDSAIPRVKELRSINDRIREESRSVLLCYFDSLSNNPLFTLDDILLMDSSVGVCETTSRLDIAISIVQTFLHRISLDIEDLNGTLKIFFTNKESLIWSNQYSSFDKWKNCKLRECYSENFVMHDIIKEDSKSPGFRFLRDNLKKDVLTVPVSGGISKLNGNKPPHISSLIPLQEYVPSTISSISPVVGNPPNLGVKKWESTDHADQFNFWVETAEQLDIPYLRVAAAGLPSAAIQYSCKDASCCNSCSDEGNHRPVTEYYFWLIQSRCYEEIKQSYQAWDDPDNNIMELLFMEDKEVAFLAWSKVENGVAGAVQWAPTGIKADSDSIELNVKGRIKDVLWIEAINGTTALEELFDSNGDPIDGTDIVPGFRFDLVTEQVITLPKIGEILPDGFNIEEDPFYFLYHDLGAPRFPKKLDGTVYLIAQQLQSNCDFKGAKEWLDVVLHTLKRDNRWDNAPESASRRALLMSYLDILIKWADHLQEQNTPESISKAKMILNLVGKILGVRPKRVNLPKPETKPLNDFTPLASGINPRLLCIYDAYDAQKQLLEHCLTVNGQQCKSIAKKQTNADCASELCCNTMKDCLPISPYRFMPLLNRAKEYANALSGLGSSLQAAIEKGDQEKLTFLREVHSNQLTHLNLDMKQNLVREAHYQVKALEKTLEITETRLVYHQGLINVGLIAQEEDYKTLTKQSMIAQAASQGLNASAQFIVLLPEIFPPWFTDAGGGTKTAAALQGGAAVASAIAGILQTRATLKNYDAGNIRREQGWVHQRNTLLIEIEHIKNQLVAASITLLNAQKDLDNYRLQIDHSNQTLGYLRDKFTNQELYQWQENELHKLCYELYKCTMQIAYQAEKAYNVERCYSNEQFFNTPFWNRTYRGFLAGEQISSALRNMEKRYMDTNHKWYELTKSISLIKEMPRAFLMIKYNGSSIVKISEDLFAFDHPNHFCRVYKNIAVTIPCVVGPYVNVNASMTLKNSFVRTSNEVLPVNCSEGKYSDGYRMRSNDKRFVYIAGGKDTLATSKAVQDSGYHQLSFQDELNLTFENAGVEAEFCFTLKKANNQFDTGSISDIILETSYMAKEGGAIFGKAASKAVKHRLPGNGELLINLPDQFPDAWYQMQSGGDNQLRLELGKQDFPFLAFDANLEICQMEFIIETEPCQECDIMEVIFKNDELDDCDDIPITCHRSFELGGKVFHGALVRNFPIKNSRAFLGNLCFAKKDEIKNCYLLISYKAVPLTCPENDIDCC